MAPATIKKLICDALEDLSSLDLEKFTSQLLDRREKPRILRSKVEGKSFLVVTDVIVSTFCEYNGLLVTLSTLRDIGCNEDASRLESEARANGHMESDGPGAASDDESRFVDTHRDKLIQKVTVVEPILDVLRQKKVIHEESYSRILAMSVAQDKMRELYRILGPEGNTESKKLFYRALKNIQPFIVDELDGPK